MRLEILRMKITRIRLSMGNAQPVKNFNGIYAAISFVLPGDVYGTTTYYMNIGYGDCVAVSRDGTMTVQPSGLPESYISRIYNFDFSEIIDSATAAVLQCRLCIAGCVKKSAAENAMLDVWMQISNRSLFLRKRKRPKSSTALSIAVAKDLKCICATSQTRQCKDKPSFKGRVCCGERVY